MALTFAGGGGNLLINKNQCPSNLRFHKFFGAFTLAEVLVTLTILGILASLIVPSVSMRVKENSNRAKIVKAMATYENFVNQFVADTGAKSDAEVWSAYTSCGGCDCVMKYFKVSKVKYNHQARKCKFITSDGLFWEFQVAIHDDKENTLGLGTLVSFADESKILIDGKPVELPNDEVATNFRFYHHFDPDTNALYVNDPAHVPWYKFPGYKWCQEHPFGHGCWTGIVEYDSTVLLPWQYIKKIKYEKYDPDF